MSLSRDHLNRRVNDALNSASEERPSVSGVTNAVAFQPQQGDREFSFLERLKSTMNEKVLPKMNLTSYNNLRRARDQINATNQHNYEMQALQQSVMAQREQIALDLQSVATDRDRLATKLHETQITSAENAALVQELTREIKHTTKENTRLITMLNNLQTALIRVGEVNVETSPVAIVQRVTEELYDSQNVQHVKEMMLKFFGDDGDPNLGSILPIYDEVIENDIPYWDIRIAAYVLSKVIKPRTYLEVGTRRGWSLAQVMAETPDVHVFVFDVWHEEYADAQGNPKFVLTKMQEITEQKPRIEFINGNSHDTLPAYFAGENELDLKKPPQMFDLVTVDGDHSLIGAWQDLYDVFPHVRVGGAILFDDLEYSGEPAFYSTQYERPPLPENVTSLRDVWHKMQSLYPNFVFIDCTRLSYQAGIAIRMS